MDDSLAQQLRLIENEKAQRKAAEREMRAKEISAALAEENDPLAAAVVDYLRQQRMASMLGVGAGDGVIRGLQ